MAQAAGLDTSLSETLTDEFLQCPLCMDQFTSPKVLPCQHTFCLKCLKAYVEARSFYAMLPCPLCKELFAVPDHNVDNFRNNFMIVSLLQVVENTKKASENASHAGASASGGSADQPSVTTAASVRECGACDEPSHLANFCHVCTMWLCAVCSKAHRKVPSTAGHLLISNEEVDRQCKEMVDQGERKVTEMQTDNSEAEDFYLGQMRELPENAEAVRSKIKAVAQEAQDTIKEKMDNLLQKVDGFYLDQENEMCRKLYKADERKKKLEKTLELLNVVRISNDGPYNQNAINSVQEFLSSNVDMQTEDISNECSVNLAFTSFTNNMKEMKQLEMGSLRKVTSNASSHFLNDRPLAIHKESCLVEREYISSLAINKLAHKFFVVNNKSVLVLKYNTKIPTNFLSPLSERNVERPWGIAYSVEDCRVFISEAGKHEGEGAVISYNHDGAFHSVVASGLTLPRGIAVHKNLVFVCDQIDRCVYIMNLWGKVVRVLRKTPDGQFIFNGPMFISVGRSGTFAVSDNCNSVKIFDKDCKLLKTYTSELADSEFWDVLVLHSDTVVVCDWRHGLHRISPHHDNNGLLAVDTNVVMKEPSALAALDNGNSIYIGTCGGEIFSAI